MKKVLCSYSIQLSYNDCIQVKDSVLKKLQKHLEENENTVKILTPDGEADPLYKFLLGKFNPECVSLGDFENVKLEVVDLEITLK